MGATGEKQGSTNVHNRGGLTSILFSRDGAAAPGAARWGWWPEGFLHELTHNLGAVQWGRPHSTQPAGQNNPPPYGHCWQGADVMCYTEDAGASHPDAAPTVPVSPGRSRRTTTAAATTTSIRPPLARLLPRDALEHLRLVVPRPVRLDRPGLRRRSALGPRTTGGVHRPRRSAAAPRRGTTLVARNGEWNNSPTGFAYQWQRLLAAGWEDINDRDRRRSYLLTSQDLGRRLRVAVIATNHGRHRVAPPRPRLPRSAPPASTAPRAGPEQGVQVQPREVRRQGQDERQEGQGERRPRTPRPRRPRPRKAEGQEGQGQEEVPGRPTAGRAQCRDRGVPARQAHPRIAGSAATRTSSAPSS